MSDMSSSQALADRPGRPSDLPDWLISHGRHWLTVREGAALLRRPADQVPAALARARERGVLFSPTPGGYVPVPPEFRSWRAVPAAHFIDPWMRHLGHAYYVGLLSAAEIHGAAHQRPQVFQVVTDARMRNRVFGRVRVQFIRDAQTAQRPKRPVNTPTGTMLVSTPEVTVLDLVEHPRHGGGMSNVATVVGELLEDHKVDVAALAAVAEAYPIAVRQRTGWILDTAAALVRQDLDLSELRKAAERATPTPLDASAPRSGPIDSRWNVILNSEIEPDL